MANCGDSLKPLSWDAAMYPGWELRDDVRNHLRIFTRVTRIYPLTTIDHYTLDDRLRSATVPPTLDPSVFYLTTAQSRAAK